MQINFGNFWVAMIEISYLMLQECSSLHHINGTYTSFVVNDHIDSVFELSSNISAGSRSIKMQYGYKKNYNTIRTQWRQILKTWLRNAFAALLLRFYKEIFYLLGR